jgi:hypothetical protein
MARRGWRALTGSMGRGRMNTAVTVTELLEWNKRKMSQQQQGRKILRMSENMSLHRSPFPQNVLVPGRAR